MYSGQYLCDFLTLNLARNGVRTRNYVIDIHLIMDIMDESRHSALPTPNFGLEWILTIHFNIPYFNGGLVLMELQEQFSCFPNKTNEAVWKIFIEQFWFCHYPTCSNYELAFAYPSESNSNTDWLCVRWCSMFCLLAIRIVLALDQRSDLRVWCVSNMNSLNTNELPYIYRGKLCNKIDVYGTQADEKTVAKPHSRLFLSNHASLISFLSAPTL